MTMNDQVFAQLQQALFDECVLLAMPTVLDKLGLSRVPEEGHALYDQYHEQVDTLAIELEDGFVKRFNERDPNAQHH